MLEVEAPARRLAAAIVAHDAVEPAFKTAGQVEISPVDRQHQRAIEHARIEPVGQDQLDPERPALRVEPFLPLVDPGETMAAALVLLADGCGDGRRLQPVERGFEAVIIVTARPAPDIGQYLMRGRRHEPRGRPSGIAGLDELARRPRSEEHQAELQSLTRISNAVL